MDNESLQESSAETLFYPTHKLYMAFYDPTWNWGGNVQLWVKSVGQLEVKDYILDHQEGTAS